MEILKPQMKEIWEQIISGELSPAKIANLTADDLVTEDKKTRKIELEKQLLHDRMISDKIQIISKSHKGEQVFDIGGTDSEQS